MTTDDAKQDPLGLQENEPNPSAVRRGAIIGWGGVVAAILLVGAVVWTTDRHPRSDEARVTANVVGIAPRVSGPILALPIEDNQQVEAGEILFEIDPEPFVIAVAIAQANRDAVAGEVANARGGIEAQRLQVEAARAGLRQVETTLAQAEETYQRLAPLLEKRFTTPEAVDTARRARDTASAAVSVAEAELEAARALIQDVEPLLARQRALSGLVEAAELSLGHTVVRAPFPARVAALTISEGAFARIGFDTVTLIDTRRWWVVADFRESELRHIGVGDRARVTLATAPGLEVGGVVEGIDWGVTAMPQDPFPGLPIVLRQLDWVHIAQRFPVHILLDPDTPEEFLRVGATATATILGKAGPED
ncbi:MAG: biotin/lipoyl-binding protein [Myxococcota bacterium]|nr:biotin/lipoyl-binding protein [Myxococcota bacterium]